TEIYTLSLHDALPIWIQIHLHVVELPHSGGVETVQPFHNDEFARLNVFRTDQRARAVVVHRLEHGLSVVCALQMQFEDIEKIAVRMQWGDVQPCSFLPVVLVIIIGTDVRDALWTQQLRESLCDGGLAGSTIAYNAQEYRSLRHGLSFVAEGASQSVCKPL